MLKQQLIHVEDEAASDVGISLAAKSGCSSAEYESVVSNHGPKPCLHLTANHAVSFTVENNWPLILAALTFHVIPLLTLPPLGVVACLAEAWVLRQIYSYILFYYYFLFQQFIYIYIYFACNQSYSWFSFYDNFIVISILR